MIIEELAQYLAAQGFGVYDPDGTSEEAATIFLEQMPEEPDSCLCVYTRGGGRHEPTLRLGRPQLQVLVRGDTNPLTALRVAQRVLTITHGLHQAFFTEGGTKITLCTSPNSQPVPLGPDENGRHTYSVTLNIISEG